MKYPVTNFIHLDDYNDSRETNFIQPNANSTFINQSVRTNADNETQSSIIRNISVHTQYPDDFSIGHISHIPRKPPTPTTYTIPSFTNKSVVSDDEDLFGMIKLKDNDICYTSGSIEWVGKKRSYPINSGFKIINESLKGNEPSLKKVRLDNTFTMGNDQIKECDCADVLPTVNAIVDHLNALHEAIDLVDLRLHTLEDVDK